MLVLSKGNLYFLLIEFEFNTELMLRLLIILSVVYFYLDISAILTEKKQHPKKYNFDSYTSIHI